MSPEEEGVSIARAKREIEEDIALGRVPADVASFSALHEHVDANEYGGICDDFAEAGDDFVNAVQDALDEWIKAGRVSVAR